MADVLKVWFNEWQIKPGDNIPAKIKEGPEHPSMSVQAFGSDSEPLEADSFRFRDPLNTERRCIPRGSTMRVPARKPPSQPVGTRP
jgi:hypothetical protein